MITHNERACASASRRPACKKPTIFIEVQLTEKASNDPLIRNDDIIRDIHKWLESSFVQVKVAQHLDTRSLTCRDYIRSLNIADFSQATVYPDEEFHILAECELDIAVYSLCDGEDADFTIAQTGNDNSTHFNVMSLPHRALDGLWESLIFAEPIRESSFRILTRMMWIAKQPRLDSTVIYWHNLVLLYGPPGSGKTTLSQALAQKLSIRLSQSYSATKLVEINSHTLLSKWFGESSKLVGKLFEAISTMSSDESSLIVVLIDEVETLAGSREKASKGSECGDAIRSTNELLQGLDRLRKRPNVVFICTSNLIDNIDPAFVDRCGIEQCVETPSVKCAYGIFRSVLNELLKAGLVFFDPIELDSDPSLSNHRSSNPHQQRGTDSNDFANENLTYLPELEWVELHLFDRIMTAPWELRMIAAEAEGLSGRTLRRLPMLAMAKYTVKEPCDMRDILIALRRVVKEKNINRSKEEGEPEKPSHASSEDDQDGSDELRDMSLDDLFPTSTLCL